MTQKAYARSGASARKSEPLTASAHKNQLHRPREKTSLSGVVCPYSFELDCDIIGIDVRHAADRVSTVTSTFSSRFPEALREARNSLDLGISSDNTTRGNERERSESDKSATRASRRTASVRAGADSNVDGLNGGRRDEPAKTRRARAGARVDHNGSRLAPRAHRDRSRSGPVSALRLEAIAAKRTALPSVQSAAGGAP